MISPDYFFFVLMQIELAVANIGESQTDICDAGPSGVYP
jgi:hypothetical protein